MHNTVFIIVAHLGGISKLVLLHSFCIYITFHEFDYRYRDILDNQDHFIASIEV